MNCVLIKMGGKGVRFGESVPKQFYEIDGEPLFAYVLRQYIQVDTIDKYIIVTNPEWMLLTKKYASLVLGSKLLDIVTGGTTNAKSTYNGVTCAAKYLKDDDILLVHDITDPIICPKAINQAIEQCRKYKCVAVVTEQLHTLYTKDQDGFITGIIEKHTVGSGYSPEAFNFGVVYECFHGATEYELENMTSAMALVNEHGYRPFSVVSHQIDLKITYREDMNALKLLIRNGERLYPFD